MEQFASLPGALLLVPTATMAGHLRHQLTRQGSAVSPRRIRTLAQFLDQCSPLAAAPEALVYHLLEQSLADRPPERFRGVADQSGFITALVRLFAEAPAARLPQGVKGDLGGLFTHVEAELAQRGMASRHVRLESAANQAASGAVELPELFLLDGFFKFSASEQTLLAVLARRTGMMITLPDSLGAQPTRQTLLALELNEPFQEEKLPAIQGPRATARQTIFHAETIEAELEEIARRIVAYVSADPTRHYRDVGIVLRSRELYGPLLETTLARFGIPFRSYFTAPLGSHPAVAYLSKLVGSMLAGWDHESLLEALRMPVSGLGATKHGDAFEFALRERIPGHGLPIYWQPRRSDYGKTEKLPPLPPIFERLLTLDSTISSSPRQLLSPSTWAAKLQEITTLIPEPSASSGTSRDQVQAWRATSAALRAFCDVLQIVAAGWSGDPVPLRAFWARVETALRLEPLRIPDDRRNVVHVLDAYEARQWELPQVFVCGLTERHFPQYHQQDPVLPDADRRRAGLDTSEDQQLAEPFLFQLATSRATGETVVSYPRFDEKGDPSLPSFFLETGEWASLQHQAAEPRPRAVTSSRSIAELTSGLVKSTTAPTNAPVKLSASSVESFLQCPFQFYARKTVHLRQRPKAPRDRLDNLLQGTILHEALAEWSRAPLLGESVLDQVFQAFCARERVPLTYRAEAVRLELKRHFAAFIADQQVALSDWQSQVEASFDFALTPELSIRGRIDRMDVSPDGDVLVIDYKYSAADKIRGHVAGAEAGEKVQGGLYLLAAERHFGHRPAGMLFCGLKKGVTWDGWHNGIRGLEQIGERFTTEGLTDLVQQTATIVLDTHAAIMNGHIAPNPRDVSKCDWCEVRDICRIEDKAHRAHSDSESNEPERASGGAA